MGFLKNLFKRKPGGTFVGNLIRGAANQVSGGLLGNGAMMIQPQETPAQADSRIIQGAAAAVATFQDTANQAIPQLTPQGSADVGKSVTKGIADYLTKENMPKLLGGLFIMIVLVYFAFFKRK